MKSILGSRIFIVLQYLLFLAVGIYFVKEGLGKINPEEILVVLSGGNYIMVLPVLMVSLLVYWLRVHRWNVLFRTLENYPHKSNQFIALCLCYLTSFVVPRMGEIVRCMVLKRTDNTTFNAGFSTIIFERTADTLCLFVLTLVLLLTESYSQIHMLGGLVPSGSDSNPGLLFIVLCIAAFVLVVLFSAWFVKKKNAVGLWLLEFFKTIRQLIHLKNTPLFLLDTAGIWLCYYLMTYLWFFTFTESASLSLYQAFLIMVVGTFARSVPVQFGAAGLYHSAVSYALGLMGVSLLTGNSLAIIIHGFQTLFTVCMGALAFFLFLLKIRKSI